MSDHAEAVNEPVDPAEVSATSEAVEQDEQQGAATPSESSPEKESEKESGAQKRIRELVWRQREAERERDELRKQLEAAKSQQPTRNESAGEPLRAPAESDYDDIEEYRRAYDEYAERKFQMVLEQKERARQEQESAARQAERMSALRDRVAKYAAEVPEFNKDTEGASVAAHPHLIDYMVESEKAPELLHYLAKNPEHASRIESMSQAAAIRELAKVEYELERAQPKKLSDAPPPMSDVEDGPTKAPGEIREGMTAEEFVKARGGYRLR